MKQSLIFLLCLGFANAHAKSVATSPDPADDPNNQAVELETDSKYDNLGPITEFKSDFKHINPKEKLSAKELQQEQQRKANQEIYRQALEERRKQSAAMQNAEQPPASAASDISGQITNNLDTRKDAINAASKWKAPTKSSDEEIKALRKRSVMAMIRRPMTPEEIEELKKSAFAEKQSQVNLVAATEKSAAQFNENPSQIRLSDTIETLPTRDALKESSKKIRPSNKLGDLPQEQLSPENFDRPYLSLTETRTKPKTAQAIFPPNASVEEKWTAQYLATESDQTENSMKERILKKNAGSFFALIQQYIRENKDPAKLTSLLNQVGKNSETFSMQAMRNEWSFRDETLDLLLKHHANIGGRNDQGKNILMIMAEVCDTSLARFKKIEMADARLMTEVDNSGNTALMHAAASDSPNCQITAMNLIRMGAKINAQNKFGQTALMMAATGNEMKILSVLLMNNANAGLLDQQNRTALFYSTDLKKLTHQIRTQAAVSAALARMRIPGNGTMVTPTGVVQQLLAAEPEVINQKAANGETALFNVVRNFLRDVNPNSARINVQIVERLIEYKADVRNINNLHQNLITVLAQEVEKVKSEPMKVKAAADVLLMIMEAINDPQVIREFSTQALKFTTQPEIVNILEHRI